MKKNFSIVIGLLCIAFCINSCQRDDICPEATPITPRLVITFKDIDTPDDYKDVPLLSVRAATLNELIDLNESGDTIRNIDSISIPLNPATALVDFIFTRNTNDGTNENEDNLQFSYTTQDEYINRACAFKANFLDLQFSFDGTNPDNWIRNIQIIEPNVTNELTTHVTIFH